MAEPRQLISCSLAFTRQAHLEHDWTPQPGMDPVHCLGVTVCAHCGLEIEDKAAPSIDGRQKPHWAHVPGGYSICYPQQASKSPRAEPAP